MAEYRQYTEDEKATALTLLKANDGNVQMTALALGIPWSTVAGWRDGRGVNEAVTKVGDEKALALADKLDSLVEILTDGITPDKVGDATVSQISTAVGTFIDKARLLREQASPDAERLAESDERLALLRARIAAMQAGATADTAAE